MTDKMDRDRVRKDFDGAVNMTPTALKKWLHRDESKHSGWKEDDGDETIGHHSGRRIVEIMRKMNANLTNADYEHMRKVVGYIQRHPKQGGPEASKEYSPWRYSLMAGLSSCSSASYFAT